MDSPIAHTTFDYCLYGDDGLEFNGEWSFPSSKLEARIEAWVNREFRGAGEICPFCKVLMRRHNFEAMHDSNDEEAHIEFCLECAFWRYLYYCNNWASFPSNWFYHLLSSKTRSFDENFSTACNSEIAQQLRRHPSRWHTIDPTKFEKLVVDIFRENLTACEVFHVGKSHDGGVDAFFIDTDHKQWLIQVKNRESSRSGEGVKTIREMLGTLAVHGQIQGIVVSTADHFTTFAIREADMARKNFGLHLDLLDRGKLNRMLDPFLPVRPWLTGLRTIDQFDSQHPTEILIDEFMFMTRDLTWRF